MTNVNFESSFIPVGWQCPVCGTVWNPNVQMCLCDSNKGITYETSTSVAKPSPFDVEVKLYGNGKKEETASRLHDALKTKGV